MSYDELTIEVMVILIEKTTGEASERVKTVEREPQMDDREDGILAYSRVHRWFSQTGSLGLVERRARIMLPEKAGFKAKKDEDLIRYIEAWKAEIDGLKKLEPDEPPLTDAYNLVALKSILPEGEIKKFIEMKEYEWLGDGYQRVEDETIRWATRKKSESVKPVFPSPPLTGPKAMDVDGVDKGTDEVPEELSWHWNPTIENWSCCNIAPTDWGTDPQAMQWPDQQQPWSEGPTGTDIDAIGKGRGVMKGKGKGKGKSSKGAGKGGKGGMPYKGKGSGKGKGANAQSLPNAPFTRKCDYCGIEGHTKNRCPHLGKGSVGSVTSAGT